MESSGVLFSLENKLVIVGKNQNGQYRRTRKPYLLTHNLERARKFYS